MKKRYGALLWMLIITAVLIAAFGAWLKYTVLQPLGLYQEESVIAVPFLLTADEEAKYTLQAAQNDNVTEDPTVPEETLPVEEETIPAETEAPVDVQQPEETIPETLPAETEPETMPVLIEIDESWFDDALFIGDSRTQGLSAYGRLGDAHYFCEVGMTVYNVQSARKGSQNYPKTNLAGLLEKYQYGKIYIHLGLNEIMGDWDQLIEKYQELIDLIHEKQPDAVIILQSIMTVTRDKAASAEHFSLESIQALDARIKELAVGDYMRYLDTNEWLADEEGYMPDDISQDGCHLYGTGYREWAQWYMDTAATLGIE